MRISDWSSDVCSSDLRAKCLDHELADSLPYYRALITALARLAGAHLSGRLSPDVENAFPFDAEAAISGDKILWDQAKLDRKSVVEGKGVSVRVDRGGRRIIKKKKTKQISMRNR